jgi:hypothetical protein
VIFSSKNRSIFRHPHPAEKLLPTINFYPSMNVLTENQQEVKFQRRFFQERIFLLDKKFLSDTVYLGFPSLNKV